VGNDYRCSRYRRIAQWAQFMNSPALAFWSCALVAVMLHAEQRLSSIGAKAHSLPIRRDRASSRCKSGSD